MKLDSIFPNSNTKISKEIFLKVYNSHPANKWTKFIFRYFSKETKQENRWLSKLVTIILLSLFILGFISTILHFNNIFMGIVTILFTLILLFVTVSMFIAAMINNVRIKKIRKELKLSIKEYNYYASMYLSK